MKLSLAALATAAVLSLPQCLSAAPPEVPKEATAKVGAVKEIVIRSKGEIGFRLVGPAAFRELKGDSAEERVFWFVAEEPGSYAIVWWTKGETGSAVTTVTVPGAPAPKPDPKPKPDDPKPDPDPASDATAAKVVVVIVEETAVRTAATAKTLYEKSFRDWAEAGKHEIEIIDPSDPAYARANYDAYAKGKYPYVLVFDAAATGPAVPLRHFRLPASGAALKSEVEKAVKK